MNNGILKKEILILLENPEVDRLNKHEIADLLGIKGKKNKRRLKEILFRLYKKDRIVKNTDGTYSAPIQVKGQLLANNRGFGFVRPEEDIFGGDIFIPAHRLNGAYDKDEVIVEVFPNSDENRRPEGSVIDVLKRGHEKVVGTFEETKKNGFAHSFFACHKIFKCIFLKFCVFFD